MKHKGLKNYFRSVIPICLILFIFIQSNSFKEEKFATKVVKLILIM